eukprot:791903-Prorocentrum_minimum.AAC.1
MLVGFHGAHLPVAAVVERQRNPEQAEEEEARGETHVRLRDGGLDDALALPQHVVEEGLRAASKTHPWSTVVNRGQPWSTVVNR